MSISTKTATIAVGASLSSVIDCGMHRFPRAIKIDASGEGSTFTFQASHDNSTFANVNDDLNVELSIPFTAGEWAVLDPATFAAFRYWKVRTGSSASATNQADAVGTITMQVGVL